MGCHTSRPRKDINPDDDSSDTSFSDAKAHTKLEVSVAALPWPEPTEDDLAKLRATWWGLGEEKWMENIDEIHWHFGKFVYDLCLHSQNNRQKEIGYLSSMYDAWIIAEEELGRRVDSAFWLRLHKAAMSHPGNNFLVGKFRNQLQGNRALVAPSFPNFPSGVNDACFKEFNKMPKRLCSLHKYSDARYNHERRMPPNKRKTIRHYLNGFLNEFYFNVRDIPKGDEKILPEAAKLMQRICRMEPSRDGNTRTLVVLINKLLTDQGLHPCLFTWPDVAGTISLAEWTEEFTRCYKKWEFRCNNQIPDTLHPRVRAPREVFVAPESPSARQENAFFNN